METNPNGGSSGPRKIHGFCKIGEKYYVLVDWKGKGLCYCPHSWILKYKPKLLANYYKKKIVLEDRMDD